MVQLPHWFGIKARAFRLGLWFLGRFSNQSPARQGRAFCCVLGWMINYTPRAFRLGLWFLLRRFSNHSPARQGRAFCWVPALCSLHRLLMHRHKSCSSLNLRRG